MEKMTDAEILEMGHRRARTYRHDDEPKNIGYGFDRATLLDLARAIESKAEANMAEAIGAGGVSALMPARPDSAARKIVANLLHRHRFARRMYRQNARDRPDDLMVGEWAHENEAWNAYASSKKILFFLFATDLGVTHE